MNEISIELYELGSYSNNKKYFKSLTNSSKKEYLYLYKKYSDMLYKYFIKKYNLDEIDNFFINSKHNYKETNTNDLDFYQYLSKKYLKYLYIRNNIYIERLSDIEKEFLKNIKEFDLDFIKNTYLKVILEDNDLNSKTNTFYGEDNPVYLKPSNAIIIGFKYNRYDKPNNINYNEWTKLHNLRLFDFDIVKAIFKKYVEVEKNVSTYLIKY